MMVKERCPESCRTKLLLMKVNKGRCPRALDEFANISVLCQVEHFMYAFCYQFLVIFRCFGIFPLDHTIFLTFILPGSRDVVQTVKIDLQKFRFYEPGPNLVFVLKNIAHNFYMMQKGHVIAFYKIIQ